ncbi:MAG: BlaI/MecI/CopY family transcriptional regulator [Bacteroidaceae bacterium]|nr:BlaI/MecI/CopY family transcriptional regulator [Bacteroidaceae bacterium]
MQKKKTYTLTKSELQVMNILWAAGKSLDVHGVIDRYDDPKPAYTTVATFLKILFNKKFVEYKKGTGKSHLYSPLISKAEYTRRTMEEMKNDFFNGSASSFVKFFVKAEKISRSELEELIKLIEEE